MDLSKFKRLILNWIEHRNATLSGVARLNTGTQELWSASLIIGEEGYFPLPCDEHVEVITRLLRDGDQFANDFQFYSINLVEFIMSPNILGLRWQVQWTFLATN